MKPAPKIEPALRPKTDSKIIPAPVRPPAPPVYPENRHRGRGPGLVPGTSARYSPGVTSPGRVASRPVAAATESSSLDEGGFVLAPWERAAVQRLAGLLPHETLEGLLGQLTYTVRKLREMETGQDVRGTKTDLANALIIAYGRDLLAEKPIRAAIGRVCRASHPAAWTPGSESAFAFVERCALPEELAGLSAAERQA